MQLSNLRNPFLSVKSAVSGSALMITAIVVMAMVTLSAVFLNDVVVHTRLVDNYENNYQVRYAADAGLEQVKYEVGSSGYTSNQNTWLMNNSSTAGFLAFDNLSVGNALVDVIVTDLTGGRYRATSTAEVNQTKYSVITEISTTSSYTFPSGYAYYSNVDTSFSGSYLGLDTNPGVRTIVEGNVRATRNVYFAGDYSTVVHTVSGDATAGSQVYQWPGVGGYQISGATQQGSSFILPWQNVNISQLENSASGDYRVTPSNPLYAQNWNKTKVTLLGDQIRIERRFGLTVLTSQIYPLPANGLLYIDGPTWTVITVDEYGEASSSYYTHTVDVEGGTVKGRLTIATPDLVYLKSDVTYVDNEGDSAYRINQGGTIVTDTARNVIWTAANGTVYEPNPAYNPSVPNSFGLLVGELRGNGLGYNMEFHGAIWAPGGDVGFGSNIDYATDTLLNNDDAGNLAIFGSIVAKDSIGSSISGSYAWRGWRLSNHFIYDANITTNPPPFFSPIPTYAFTSWRRN